MTDVRHRQKPVHFGIRITGLGTQCGLIQHFKATMRESKRKSEKRMKGNRDALEKYRSQKRSVFPGPNFPTTSVPSLLPSQ
jgi:hypothetical protein